MNDNETYLNHPNFGLLYKVCSIEQNRELYTTLYAQRLFFLVTLGSEGNLTFESLGRSDARLVMENRLRQLRRKRLSVEYEQLNATYQRIFR